VDKLSLDPQTLTYPMPALLVGSLVDGKANLMTAAWSGIAASNPPVISVALQHHRHTLTGVREHGCFSVNVPSAAQVTETDYCGMITGKRADKVERCGFELFYGPLAGAPLVRQCPVNLACRLKQEVELGSHVLLLGEIEGVWLSADCATDGRPDYRKIDPLVFAVGQRAVYCRLGEELGPAFKMGAALKQG